MKYNYLVQMASIKKNDWRMQQFIDKGYGETELALEESKLWKAIKEIADNSISPRKHFKFFPGSKLIGYGWEWAVYELKSNKKVVKIPAGTFSEANNSLYLKNTEYAYKVCKKYLSPFVANSTFIRKIVSGKPTNLFYQKRLKGNETFFIKVDKLPDKTKKTLIELGGGMLDLLDQHQWMPDINLYKKTRDDGKEGWNVWNLIIEDGEPRIFDFTTYYDVFRLYPQRAKVEIETKGNAWKMFIKELKSHL